MIWRLVGAGLLGALAEAAGVALMGTAVWLLITAAEQPPITALTIAIVSVRALAISRGGFRYLERLAGHDAVLRIVTEVRARIFAHLIDRPLARHADALSRMVSDVDGVQDLVVRVALPMFASGLVCVAAVVTAALIDPLAGLVLGLGLALGGVVLPVLGARLIRRGALELAPLRAAHAIAVLDVVHGAADLAAYGATQRFQAAASLHAARLSAVERRLAVRSFALDAAGGTLSALTAVGVYLAAPDRGVWTAVLTIGALATGELTLNLLGAARKYAEISGSLARVRELTTPVAPVETPSGRPVRLCGVAVAGRLHDIDLDLAPGRKIGVIGPSGAGKSTLLSVIAGTIMPDRGHVIRSGDGVATGLMADAHLFHNSIRENLKLARPDATDAELVAAGDVARIALGNRYPLETLVGEDGAELSGGERQRLGLTRALLADPEVLLLDEPTEGLDPAQADDVLRAVFDHLGDRTVVLVTHRLTGLDSLGLDEIIVMDQGRIVERGPEGWMRAHLG
ncbi:thiol reductant ABC exporter subunit CydC [Allorhizocola rhizosphaerae]|uniref:thiol reductant ABC exporter subunit CydC n=1 Tax=Allorhizocola rhizosphaerae TaxID=1872709 RepID=UPI000E3DD137|nr:thiol reductant ABC exporter subunit CydC [Allorhizocola rhizosphaerae]